MSDEEDLILLGRKAYLEGRSLEDSPYSTTSEEYGVWAIGWTSEQEHTKALALQLSAQKKLDEKIKQLQEQLDKKEEELQTVNAKLTKELYNSAEVVKELRSLQIDINHLHKNPLRWARSYRKEIGKIATRIAPK